MIGAGRGVEERGAVSAWAAVLPGARLDAFRLETLKGDDRLIVVGMPEAQDDDVVGVLLADPYSFPVDAFVERSDEALPGLLLVGGLAEGSGLGETGHGEARLCVGGEVYREGAVGVVIGGAVAAATVVSQGARPIGPDMVVTRAEENVLYELAGVPALEKLEQIVLGLPEEEQELAGRGLLIGVAMNEYADVHEHGDFLVRGVVGADTDTGAIAIGDVVDVGRTVRFQVRDAGAAEEDLAALLERFDLAPVEGALLISCNGRGQAMFPDSDHDAKVLDRAFGPAGVGGFFAAGEIGPVAGRNHVHGFTASILAFGRAEEGV
ncbi:FIST N-terminal domain-containing protein [Actinomadura luteofluorescens]